MVALPCRAYSASSHEQRVKMRPHFLCVTVSYIPRCGIGMVAFPKVCFLNICQNLRQHNAEEAEKRSPAFFSSQTFSSNFRGAFWKIPCLPRDVLQNFRVLHFVFLDLQLWLGHSSNVSQNELHDSYWQSKHNLVQLNSIWHIGALAHWRIGTLAHWRRWRIGALASFDRFS